MSARPASRAEAPRADATPAAHGRTALVWAPAVAWAALIFHFSTDVGSIDATRSWLEPALARMLPFASAEAIEWIHLGIRKTAHGAEYFVFAVLLERAFRLGSGLGERRAAAAALAAAALYAVGDEAHQALTATRGASAVDCAIDVAGAAVAVRLLRARRAARPSAERTR